MRSSKNLFYDKQIFFIVAFKYIWRPIYPHSIWAAFTTYKYFSICQSLMSGSYIAYLADKTNSGVLAKLKKSRHYTCSRLNMYKIDIWCLRIYFHFKYLINYYSVGVEILVDQWRKLTVVPLHNFGVSKINLNSGEMLCIYMGRWTDGYEIKFLIFWALGPTDDFVRLPLIFWFNFYELNFCWIIFFVLA